MSRMVERFSIAGAWDELERGPETISEGDAKYVVRRLDHTRSSAGMSHASVEPVARGSPRHQPTTSSEGPRLVNEVKLAVTPEGQRSQLRPWGPQSENGPGTPSS